MALPTCSVNSVLKFMNVKINPVRLDSPGGAYEPGADIMMTICAKAETTTTNDEPVSSLIKAGSRCAQRVKPPGGGGWQT